MKTFLKVHLRASDVKSDNDFLISFTFMSFCSFNFKFIFINLKHVTSTLLFSPLFWPFKKNLRQLRFFRVLIDWGYIDRRGKVEQRTFISWVWGWGMPKREAAHWLRHFFLITTRWQHWLRTTGFLPWIRRKGRFRGRGQYYALSLCLPLSLNWMS